MKRPLENFSRCDDAYLAASTVHHFAASGRQGFSMKLEHERIVACCSNQSLDLLQSRLKMLRTRVQKAEPLGFYHQFPEREKRGKKEPRIYFK